MSSRADTLIVIAAFDDKYAANIPTLCHGGRCIVMDTSGGGHPSYAFIRAYRENPYYADYLFLQDSLEGQVPDVVAPFREVGAPVVAWGVFNLFFDSERQAKWVMDQYGYDIHPSHGIFGPIFYARREAMKELADLSLFPKQPQDKHEAQGTERAWAYAFMHAEVPVTALSGMTTDGVRPNLFPSDQTFIKTFGNRQ